MKRDETHAANALLLSHLRARNPHAAGYRSEQAWSGGKTTCSEETFAPGWLFGAWGKAESEWMLDTYKMLGRQ